MILVFGSLNMDLVMTVPVLPKPGETVLCPGYTLKPGGKGNNQAVAAARAGAPVAMAGCVGPDAFGSGLVENLVRAGVDTSDINLVEQPTGCAMICVDADAENFITVASGANLAAASDRIADSKLGPGTTVLMQMEVPAEQNWALIRRAHDLGSRTVLNVAPAADVPSDILKLIDVLVVNEHEAADIGGRLGLSTSSSTGLARDLARTCGVTCVVTLGSAGALMAESGGALWTAAPLKINPVDTTGAGDAFCGILTAALDGGAEPKDALHRASVGASLACMALGAQESLPTSEAIDARLRDVAEPLRLS
jgi:ribokinase